MFPIACENSVIETWDKTKSRFCLLGQVHDKTFHALQAAFNSDDITSSIVAYNKWNNLPAKLFLFFSTEEVWRPSRTQQIMSWPTLWRNIGFEGVINKTKWITMWKKERNFSSHIFINLLAHLYFLHSNKHRQPILSLCSTYFYHTNILKMNRAFRFQTSGELSI